MSRFITGFILAFVALSGYAQNNKIMQTGFINYQELSLMPEFGAINNNNIVNESKNDTIGVNVATLLKNKKVLIFLGVWCSDSKSLVPEVVRFLYGVGMSPEDIQYYLLDDKKKSVSGLERNYEIAYVPTFIFIDKFTNKEVGRIVEELDKGLIPDIYNILSEQ